MKKILLVSIFMLGLFFQAQLYAQVPNGGFENWDSATYFNPSGWFTGNQKSINRMGVAPVTRVTGAGVSGYAVRIQTFTSGGDTSDSYISNTNGDPLSGQGGVPFPEQPTRLRGQYRCNLVGSDTALIVAVFKNSGNIIYVGTLKLTGSQSTFTTFNLNLTLPMIADTMILAAASSNLISNVGVQGGSFLELDALTFGVTTAVPNGAFENWDSLTYRAPVGWEINGDSIFRTTDHFAGTYAIKMKTEDYGGGNINGAYITTGHETNSGPRGGLPFSSMVDTLTGYYKYTASGSDSAICSITLTHLGTIVGGNSIFLPPAATYTLFKVPISAGSTPDTMRIDFISSKFPYTPQSVNSTLYLDRLILRSVLVDVASINGAATNGISSYPNPANDVLNIEFRKSPVSDFDFLVYNVNGSLVKKERINSNGVKYQLNIAELSPGTYFYEAVSKDGQLHNSFLKK